MTKKRILDYGVQNGEDIQVAWMQSASASLEVSKVGDYE